MNAHQCFRQRWWLAVCLAVLTCLPTMAAQPQDPNQAEAETQTETRNDTTTENAASDDETAQSQDQTPAEHQADHPMAGRSFKLPGLTANLEDSYVDIDASICLDEGYLELIACTKGTKEHESLVVIDANPRHVHAALLLIGAVNGHPAMRKQIGEGDDTRWVHLPPRGELVQVSLVLPDGRGNENAFPISDFVAHINAFDDGMPHDQHVFTDQEEVEFPDEFLFVGSHLVEPEEGQAQYIADVSGHVITVATFGDEVLCLPGQHSTANGELVWRVNPEMMPAVGSKVKLRISRIAPEAPETPDAPDTDAQDTMDSP